MTNDTCDLYGSRNRKYRVYRDTGDIVDETDTFEKATWSAKDFKSRWGFLSPFTIYGYDIVGEELKNKTELMVVN